MHPVFKTNDYSLFTNDYFYRRGVLTLTEIDKRLARIKRHKRVRKNISGRA